MTAAATIDTSLVLAPVLPDLAMRRRHQ
jgi:hypothetical protein